MVYNTLGIPEITRNLLKYPVPEGIIKQREGGGKKTLSYISGAAVTDMLNMAFNYNWNWEVKQYFIQESKDYYNKYAKKDEEKIVPQGPVAHVLGTLTVHFEDKDGKLITIKKDGFGSKSILGKQADQESIFKAADTDALKKAASRLGLGLDLYRGEEEQEFFEVINDFEEDPWTDEELEKHADQLKYISFIKENTSEEDLNKLIQSFSEGNLTDLEDITPQNVDTFCDFLKELEEQSEE